MADSLEHIWAHCLKVAARTDVGLRRSNNQDSFTVDIAPGQQAFEQRGHLFVVADGMGAHAAGELASKIATDSVALAYRKLKDLSPPEALLTAVREANTKIHTKGQTSDDFRGMGTTISALAILPQGAVIAQVGDSRVYRYRNHKIEQLTFDHSMVWELRAANQFPDGKVPDFIPKNVITRSLGPNPEVQVDLEGPFPIQAGDVFLLCSDGLSNQFDDAELGQILASLPPEEAVEALVDLANLRGGPDNITVIVVQVLGPQQAHEDKSQPAPPTGQRMSMYRLLGWALALVLAIGAGFLWLEAYPVAALASLVVAAGLAVLSSLREHVHGSTFGLRRLGKGPYTAAECRPGEDLVRNLQGVIRDLRRAAAEENWEIDWSRFDAHEQTGDKALSDGDFAAAIAGYCRAISDLMRQLKGRRERTETIF
ncbi:MAG: serine/threonine-protein phosphatase [Planctomycetota bacterium]|nr:MAG: serine/threonine-protein phosphatase [Planctomycetota bacterium]